MEEGIHEQTAVLAERAGRGESSAFDGLVALLGERLWRSALVMCREEDLARDLVQETWLQVWKSLPRYDAARSQFTTWMHSILYHCYLKHVRREKRKPLVLVPDWQHAKVACPNQRKPGAELQEREASQTLQRMLKDLPEEQRRVVELRFFAEASLGEIAILLNCPEGTVKSRMHHALKKLRENSQGLNLWDVSGQL